MLMFNRNIVFLLCSLAVLSGALLLPLQQSAQAQELIVPIAGITNASGMSLPQYISRIYTWGIGLAALLAVLMIVIGGAEYIFAAGSFGEAEAGKNRIKSAVMGLILLLSISLLLSILGTRLTNISLDPLALTGATGSPTSPEQSTSLVDKIKQDSGSYNLGELATLNKIGSDLTSLERALATNAITPAQYTEALKAVNARLNSYYADPNLFGKIKKENENFYRANNLVYTQEQLNKEAEEKMKVMQQQAYGKIISGLKNTKHPEILEQQKINAKR